MNSTVCHLCQSPVFSHPYRDGNYLFCCTGCQTVFNILASQEALDNVRSHPLFQQALRSGLIANPHLLDEIQKTQEATKEEEIHKLHLEILDMWCPSCAHVIALTLLKEKGVQACSVDYTTDLASIDYAPRYLSQDKLLRLITQLGYRPALLKDPRQQAVSRGLSLRFIVAAFFSLNVMMFAYPIYASYFDQGVEGYPLLFAWLSFFGSLPVLSYSAWPIWRRFYTGMKVGLWGMEALVLLGVGAATGLSLYELWRGSPYVYFDSMTVIIVFVLLGKIIESKAKFSAKDSLLHLARALPRRGRKRLPSGEEQFVPIKDIQAGDHLLVLSGEKIVLDGLVEEGEGSCDESLMTGESLPTFKHIGSKVLAGTILQQGHLVIRVTAACSETALFHIVEMVEQDMSHKSRYVRAADTVVKWFVPLVLALSIAIFAYCLIFDVQEGKQAPWQTGLVRAVSVLLISCPCAIGIAAPLAEAHLLNALAKMGILVRNRGCLSFLGKETAFLFDKTGTVTEGKYTVLSGLEQLSFEDKRILKRLTFRSNHPVAVALHQALLCPLASLDHVEELMGKGMRGVKGKDIYLVGSAAFLKEQGIEPLAFTLTEEAQTVVFFAHHQCLAAIKLGDRIRPEAREVVKALKTNQTFLISGDAPAAVEQVARSCGFLAWQAQCHPLQKREFVMQLRKKGEIVAMLGDGVNDAPALTAAHIGIAVVSATDISIQVSDLLLTTDRLQALTLLRAIAQKGCRIIKQNLFWAFFYNCAGIGLALSGALSPLFAAFAMVVSSLIVLGNAQRISYVQSKTTLTACPENKI